MKTELSKVFPEDNDQQLIAKKDKKLGPRYFLTASWDKIVKQFNIHSRKKVNDYKAIHEDLISAITVTSDGKYFFTASWDKSVKQFDIHSRKKVNDYKRIHNDHITAITVTSDGKYFFTVSDD